MHDLKQIYRYDKAFPVAIIQDICSDFNSYKPELIKVLDYMIHNIETVVKEDYMIHLYALSLFGQFEATDAFDSIKKFLEIESKYLDDLLGDYLEGSLDKIIYRTFDGNHEWITKMIINSNVNPYLRNCILKAYAAYLYHKKNDKETLNKLISSLLEDRMNLLDIINFIRDVVTDYHLFEFCDDIQVMCDENLFDSSYSGGYDEFIDSMYTYRLEPEVHEPFETIELFRSWYAFQDSFDDVPLSELENKKAQKRMNDVLKHQHLYQHYEPEQVISRKVGRNEPCPCGSGKKYKKCCINKRQSDANSFIEAEKKQWLKLYPNESGEEGRTYLSDHFDSEAIEIDQYLYLALYHRAIPIFVKRDYEEEARRKDIYLNIAKSLIVEKMSRENINDYGEFDKKHKIHYRVSDWIDLIS